MRALREIMKQQRLAAHHPRRCSSCTPFRPKWIRTNISLALDPEISRLMRDLLMDDRNERPRGGHFLSRLRAVANAGRTSGAAIGARKNSSACLLDLLGRVRGGLQGLAQHVSSQFEVMRFLLGMAESGVFPATLVLLAHWFPKNERARANAYWNLCQPLAIVASAQITAHLLSSYGWQKMLILEGALPFIWLPIWWFFISDHPARCKTGFRRKRREYFEKTLKRRNLPNKDSQGRHIYAAGPRFSNELGNAHVHGGDEFHAQFPSLRLHDIFHEHARGTRFLAGAIWRSVCDSLRCHRGDHAAQFAALGQNRRTPLATWRSIYSRTGRRQSRSAASCSKTISGRPMR